MSAIQVPAYFTRTITELFGQRGTQWLSHLRRGWGDAATLALDPKGVAGEPAYEVDQLAEELGFDRERIISWGLAQSVLSAWWSYEDHGHGWEEAIKEAEYLAEMR